LAFEVLLQGVEDTLLDVPHYMSYLAAFMARAISDDALAPALLDKANLSANDLGVEVCFRKLMANQNCVFVWGLIGMCVRGCVCADFFLFVNQLWLIILYQ
jgi:hypothetical protein